MYFSSISGLEAGKPQHSSQPSKSLAERHPEAATAGRDIGNHTQSRPWQNRLRSPRNRQTCPETDRDFQLHAAKYH
jgi:hypothetical protein